MLNGCFTNTPERQALAAEFHSGASKTRVLQRLSPWAIKNVVFSRVLGVMAPKGQACHVPGRLGHQNRPKGLPFSVIL